MLFLGFGQNVLPEHDEAGRRVRPPYGLGTNFADWFVEGPTAVGSPDGDRPVLETAAKSLVGEQVLHWELLESNGLRLAFPGGKALTIAPWNAAEGVSDAWRLKSPDARILAVATDGRVVVVDARLPIRDWFSDAAR